MSEHVQNQADVVGLYRERVAPAGLDMLLRACVHEPEFKTLVLRRSSIEFMAAAVRSVAVEPPPDLDTWIVQVTVRYIESLLGPEEDSISQLTTIAHEQFLIGECTRWSLDHVKEDILLLDDSDASVWIRHDNWMSLTFQGRLVHHYFVARNIAQYQPALLLRFEYPQRWVLMFVALISPTLISGMAARRGDSLRAEIAQEAEERVQSALSHQLKRSAGAVRSHLKKIRRKLSKPHFEEISSEYDRILQESQFMSALAERTGLWSAEPELRLEGVPLASVVEDALVTLREQAPLVRVDLDVSARLIAHADRGLLRELLFCLAENAFHAAAETSTEPRVTVRARTGDSTIRLEILDNGAGVHTDDAERIFHPRVTTKKGGGGKPLGTGMGLAIARKYARLLGGRVDLELASVETCFFVEIPASQEPD